jgi:hypothetical protein
MQGMIHGVNRSFWIELKNLSKTRVSFASFLKADVLFLFSLRNQTVSSNGKSVLVLNQDLTLFFEFSKGFIFFMCVKKFFRKKSKRFFFEGTGRK